MSSSTWLIRKRSKGCLECATICPLISKKNFRQMALVLTLFFTYKRGMGLTYTIYKIAENSSILSKGSRALTIPTNGTESSEIGGIVNSFNTWEGITFYPKNFHRDEPFHLNSHRNYRVFCTNGKHSELDAGLFCRRDWSLDVSSSNF